MFIIVFLLNEYNRLKIHFLHIWYHLLFNINVNSCSTFILTQLILVCFATSFSHFLVSHTLTLKLSTCTLFDCVTHKWIKWPSRPKASTQGLGLYFIPLQSLSRFTHCPASSVCQFLTAAPFQIYQRENFCLVSMM